jgi:hypothetical protein
VKHRKVALTILAALLASIALAEHFQTINGKEYKNATVSRVEPDGIVLKTKSGITKVYFTELPKDVQERFHYDSAQAARFTAAQQETATQQTAALAEQQRQQEQQRRAEAMRRNTRTVLEVESDQPRFVDQPFMLQDTIEITNYYNYGYVGARKLTIPSKLPTAPESVVLHIWSAQKQATCVSDCCLLAVRSKGCSLSCYSVAVITKAATRMVYLSNWWTTASNNELPGVNRTHVDVERRGNPPEVLGNHR